MEQNRNVILYVFSHSLTVPPHPSPLPPWGEGVSFPPSSPTPIGDPGLLLRTEEEQKTLDPRLQTSRMTEGEDVGDDGRGGCRG